MSDEHAKSRLSINTGRYRFQADTQAGTWSLAIGNEAGPLLESPAPLPLMPQLAGCSIVPGSARVEHVGLTPSGLHRVVLSARLAGSVAARVVNELLCMPDRLVCNARYVAEGENSLEHWNVVSAGGVLRGDAVHAYVGGPRGVENGTSFPLAGPVELSTASHNYMYCPIAPRVVVRRGFVRVGVGGTSVAHDFGLEFKSAADGRVEHLRFNCGGAQTPQRRPARVPQIGPRLQVQLGLCGTDDQAHGRFTGAMIDDGVVVPRRYGPEDDAWLRPWYCTWADQVHLAQARLQQDVSGDDKYTLIKKTLTQDWVLNTARMIRRLGLNIGTFIIDDGWQDFRGDWNLVTQRFPDMRALTDELHAMDFRVLMWWAPFVTEPESAVRRTPLVVGPVRYDQTVLDYTNPDTRRYVQAKLDLWFGDGPGEWNFDGVKLDFMMDKVYPAASLRDYEWYGEERLFEHLYSMVHATLARTKASPGLYAPTPNPHVARYAMAMGLEERFDPDNSHLLPRPALYDALQPGVRLVPHFNYNVEVLEDFIRTVRCIGGVPQVGTLVCPDVTPAVLGRLKELLA